MKTFKQYLNESAANKDYLYSQKLAKDLGKELTNAGQIGNMPGNEVISVYQQTHSNYPEWAKYTSKRATGYVKGADRHNLDGVLILQIKFSTMNPKPKEAIEAFEKVKSLKNPKVLLFSDISHEVALVHIGYKE